MHELSLSSAIVNTAVKHADGRRVTVVSLRVGRLRQVVPDTLEFYFEFVARETRLRGRAARAGGDRRAAAMPAVRGPSGRSRSPLSAVPTCGGSEVEIASGDEFEVESIEVEEEAECIAPR